MRSPRLPLTVDHALGPCPNWLGVDWEVVYLGTHGPHIAGNLSVRGEQDNREAGSRHVIIATIHHHPHH